MAALGLTAIATSGVIGYALTRTPPPLVPTSERTVQVDQPFEEVLRAQKHSSTATLLGEPEQPLAFAIVAPDAAALSARLIRAGWMAADRPSPENMLRLAQQGLDYPTAPLAPAFWNERMNDLAFERPIQRAQTRAVATVRVWRTSYRIGRDPIYVGVAREYAGIRWGVLHTILPDVDAATERFIESLKSSGQTFHVCQRSLLPPMVGTYLMGDQFFTRGHLWLLDPGDRTDAEQLCGAHGVRQ